MGIKDELTEEADLCRNEGANDIAVLLDKAIAHIQMLENRLEIDPAHNYDGIECRDVTIKHLDRQVQHWKSNHDNMVKRAALLSQRDDLPVDRIPAYQALVYAQIRISELESVWSDTGKLQATLLSIGFPREMALHLAGATDYDNIKSLVEEYSDTLRGLACWLSAGGWNSDGLIDPKIADEKIRWGVTNLLQRSDVQEKTDFEKWTKTLPKPVQDNIKDGMSHNQSYTYDAFVAGRASIKSKAALQWLADQAQELDMGYGENACPRCGKSQPVADELEICKDCKSQRACSYHGRCKMADTLESDSKEQTRLNNQEMMAQCMRETRRELIDAGIFGESVPPMFVTEAVLGFIGLAVLAMQEAAARQVEKLDPCTGKPARSGDDIRALSADDIINQVKK